MIQQRAIALMNLGELLSEIRNHLHVVLVDLRELIDSSRILAMMGPAVEPQRRRFAFRICPARKIACKQERADARNVGLESKRQQVELQLDVFIKSLWNAN